MSSDMLLSPVSSSAPTAVLQSPPALPLPQSHSSPNACFPALPFVAYSSSSRTRCSACHQPILLGDVRVDCLHLDCVSSAHVCQWLSSHPQLARSVMRLPSLAFLLPEDRRRAALLLHTLAQQCIQRAASPPSSSSATQRPPPLQPLCPANEHLPSIREDSVLSPTPPITHLLSPSRLQRQRTAPHPASFHSTPAFHPSHPVSAGVPPQPSLYSTTALPAYGHKRKRVASDGTVQVVESEWPEPALLSPVDSDSSMAGGSGSGRKKRRRSHEYVSMLT